MTRRIPTRREVFELFMKNARSAATARAASIVQNRRGLGVLADRVRAAFRTAGGRVHREMSAALVIARDLLDDREVLFLGEGRSGVARPDVLVEKPRRLGVRSVEPLDVPQVGFAEVVEGDALFFSA